MRIVEVKENKKKYLDLLLLADEQEDMVDRYLDQGRMFVLFSDDGEPLGEAVVADLGQTDEGRTFEIKNIATDPEVHGKGFGRKLIDYVMDLYAADCDLMLVGTGDSPLTVPFYKKCGFKEHHRLKDFFTDNYDHPIFEAGVQLVDMVYLAQKPKKKKGIDMAEITGRQRTICAFEHKKADRLPVFDVVNKPDMYVDLIGEDNYEAKGPQAVRLAEKIGMDAVMVHCAPYTCLIPPKSEWDGKNSFTDRFGIKSIVTDTSWPLGMAHSAIEADEDLLEKIRSVKVTDDDVKEVKEAVKEAAGRIAVMGGVRSAFSFLFIALGFENLSIAMYDDPDLLKEIIEAADEYWTEVGLKLIEAGCDALYVANDMGMNGSTLIAPDKLREFFFPSLKKQIKAWHDAGGRVLFHSCGNIDAILEDLADMGIDALTNLQVKAGMDLSSAVERIGDRVAIVGNVDATGIMTQPDKTKIDDAIRTVVETAGKDGGLIIATDHSFHEGIPQENVLYFIEAAKKIGTF